MAATAKYLTSVLHNTGAYSAWESGRTRQQVSDAVIQFSETLFIPDIAFADKDCGEKGAKGGRFNCLLSYGPILAVLQRYVMPLVRPGMDAPRADMAIMYARSIRNATVRAVLRNLVILGAADSVAVTAEDDLKFRNFPTMMDGDTPAPPPMPTRRGERTLDELENLLLRAARTIFLKLFIIQNLNLTTTVPNADGAARDDHEDEPWDARGSDGVLDVLRGVNGDSSASSSYEYSSGKLELSAVKKSSDSKVNARSEVSVATDDRPNRPMVRTTHQSAVGLQFQTIRMIPFNNQGPPFNNH